MDTLLVVEDDRLLRFTLRENLEAEDFVVMEAANGNRTIEILQRHRIDLILLDLHLPDCSGLDLVPRIRQQTDIPVIIVSGDHHKLNKINGLDLGADDFVMKPYDTDELIARIRASLRRYRGGENDPFVHTENENVEKVEFQGWVLDRTKFQIFDERGNSGNLTLQEFSLLDLLLACAGQALKREDLCETLRKGAYVPTERAIDVKVTRIRKKIGDNVDDPQIIKTVRGVGYMFDQGALSCKTGTG